MKRKTLQFPAFDKKSPCQLLMEGQIAVGILTLFILVVGGLYLYQSSRYNEYKVKEGLRRIRVTNTTSIPYLLVTTGGISSSIQPQETKEITLNLHHDLSASGRYPDGSEVEHIHNFANDNVSHLYITPDGFRSNLSSSLNVEFINRSTHPVVFIQKGLKGGKLQIVDLVPAKTVSEGHFVGERSLWQVGYPSSEDSPLSEIRIGSGTVSKLVFDGFSLKAL